MSSNDGEADDVRIATFTTKEMLIRVEGKIDTVLARQQTYDVDLALLKASVEGLSLTEHHRDRDVEKWQQRVDSELKDIRIKEIGELRTKEIGQLRSQTEDLARKQAYQTGALAALVVVANVLVPITLHFAK